MRGAHDDGCRIAGAIAEIAAKPGRRLAPGSLSLGQLEIHTLIVMEFLEFLKFLGFLEFLEFLEFVEGVPWNP